MIPRKRHFEAQEEEFGGPAFKKQRRNTEELNTEAWGISDDDSDEDNDNDHNIINTNNTNNNNHNNHNNNNNTNNKQPDNNNNNNESATYSSIAQRLMSKMGYVEGDSLGKTSVSGITEPIKAFQRISSRGGLGYDDKIQIKPEKHQYEAEKIEIEIKPHWYLEIDDDLKLATYSELESYLSFKPRCDRVGVEWEDKFCSIDIQKEIFTKKSEFDSIGQTKLFQEGRNKANPFEGIKREIFQNRAALKMCEIDRHLNYLITQPYNGCCITFDNKYKLNQDEILKDWKLGLIENISIHGRDLWTRELLYFADLCSGPGGFTEYFLHINKWQCRGWGFTLKNNEDFKLNKFNSNAPWDNFTPEYGPKGNGDITDNDNLISFRKKIISISMNGCHIVMADGGFDCFPNYNDQELLSRQLILCQFLGAMSILKQDGIFVCKLFDCFHPFTASIIYIASMCFKEIGLIKPNQSRPANSERYIICKGYKFGKCNTWNKKTRNVSEPHYIVKHLLDINMIINKQKYNKHIVDELKKKLERINNENEMNVDNNNNNNNNEQKTNQIDLNEELRKEIFEKESLLKEVCPLISINLMAPSFILWLKQFNETNGIRQIRHLKRIKKYLQDKTLKIDDQITIRKKALNYWFNTNDGHKFIVLDPQFGCRYVTKYEDYNYNNNLNENCIERPLNSLILNKELLQRIKFEYKNTTSYIYNDEFANHSNDFNRYQIRGDWFCIAFEFNENIDKYPPKWVTLISTGNRQIFECTRQENINNGELICISKTNDLIRLPADSVIDCIKTHSLHLNQEIYHIFDCWIIGSKSLYKRNFIQRQEFCRVLYQGYGSKYMKFAGAMPILQSLKRDCIKLKYENIYLWFIRNKKSTEQKEKTNKITSKLSQYWRPTAVKLWNPYNQNVMKFKKLLQNLTYIHQKQMQIKQKQTNHSIIQSKS